MAWFYAEGGQQKGPVDDSVLDDLVRSGVIRPETLIWREGQANWQPYSEVRSAAPGAPPLRRPGGFWIRFAARCIDAILVGIVSSIIRIPLMAVFGISAIGMVTSGDPSQLIGAIPGLVGLAMLSACINFVIAAGYETYMVATKGATLGKMALGLKVIRVDGGPLNMQQALGRSLATILSGLILFIGYIIAAFDDQKRALHDRLCDTLVIKEKS